MSKFVPSKGDLFHCRPLPSRRVIGDSIFGGPQQVARVIEHEDRSYSGDVFECVGRDDWMVVGLHRSGCNLHNGRTITFVRADISFYPVGPEVAAALGLGEQEQTA